MTDRLTLSAEARRVHAYIVQQEDAGAQIDVADVARHFRVSRNVARGWINELIIAHKLPTWLSEYAETAERDRRHLRVLAARQRQSA